MTPSKKRANKNKKYSLIVVLVFLILVLAAVAFAATQTLFRHVPANFVDVPVVQTHLAAADGSTRMFGTRVVIELAQDAYIDPNLLHRVVAGAVNSLSYEEISDFYGMENLRNAVRDRLAGSIDDDELLGIYFAQFLSDMPLPNLEEERVPGRNPLIDVFLDN